MALSIEYAPYELTAKWALNAKSEARVRHGALIRVDGVGYADIHPWVELGDAPLSEQLKLLSEGRETPLTRASLQAARRDAIARQEKKNLFEGLSIPRSHLLVTALANVDVAAWARAGFERVKIKMGRDLASESAALERIVRTLDATPACAAIKLRLDFNAACSSGAWEKWAESMSSDFWDRVDFIEDPMPFVPQSWEQASLRFKTRLALDQRFSLEPIQGYEVHIVKPAVQDPAPVLDFASREMKRIVVTSYMDHPVGQMHAAWAAARALKVHPLLVEDAGLLTHTLYEATDFSEALSVEAACLRPAPGYGIGFDDILNRQKWKHLS